MSQNASDFRIPPLKALQAFAVSARLLSFKEAATELFVTPAAISHQIRILEDHLGFKLFDRKNNSIVLTDDGCNLYPKIENAFESIANSIAEVKSKHSEKRLKVTAGPAFTSRWLATHLYEFAKLQPKVSIDMDASLAVYDFRQSGIDIAIRFGSNLPVDNVNALPLVEDAVVPVVSPEFLNSMGGTMTIEQIAECELIHDKSLSMVNLHSPNWQDWFEKAGAKDQNPSRGMVFNHGDHAIQAAIDGAGIGLVRVVLATKDIKSGRLIVPFGPMIPSGLNFTIMSRQSASKQAEISIFIQWLVDVMRRDIAAISELEHCSEITRLLKI
ncbi:MAG: LysR substrate-binding domain-containing protein [Pseudomonadota bacterium]